MCVTRSISQDVWLTSSRTLLILVWRTGRRVKGPASDRGASESAHTQREANPDRATPMDTDEVRPNGLPLLTPEETPGGTPNVQVSTPAALPIPTGADPVPANDSGIVDVQPPPAIEGMPPLSATAMASFASAAKGVTTKQEAGQVVLAGGPGPNGA
jgi:hypothetical protein